MAVRRACNFSPEAHKGGRPSSVRALRTAKQYPRTASPSASSRSSSARDRPHATYRLLEFLLGMPVRFIDRLGGLAQIVELAQLVRNTGQRARDSLANRLLTIRDHTADWDVDGGAHCGDERSEVGFGGPEQAPSKQDLPETQSRSTHSTSWPTSGCKPSRASTTKPWALRRARKRVWSAKRSANNSS